jgi:hypothetical protein
MPRWIWIAIAFCVSTTVYFTIRYGLRPKPVPVMNPTQFEGPEQIGVVVYKRLRQNVRADHLVILGSSPGEQEEDSKIWDGFNKEASAEGAAVETIQMNEFGADKQDLFKKVDDALKAKKFVIVRGLTSEVSHLTENSLSRELDRQRKHPVLSISIMRLAINKTDADDLQTQCLNTEDAAGQRKLDCAAQKVARKYLKRKLAADKLWAVMERHGLKEYLVFVHRP